MTEFDEAITVVQRSLAQGGLTSEWTAQLALRLKAPSEACSDLRRVLERHGWARGQWRAPPDRERLLQDLNERRPQDDAGCLSEDRRFERAYILEEKAVGEGTYGAVYRGRCVQSNRVVAIKRIKTDHEEEGVPSTAIREVAVLKGCDHPNIVKLLDVSCTPGKLNLVFEFVELNLKQHMKKRQKLEPSEVRNLQQQFMRGIDFCHSHRIIHRDLKPQNILIDGNGALKIADFGMARAFSVPIPRYTHEVVTMWYRAPEILFGGGKEEYSLPVDIWSAGCILGEMATGAALFHGDSEIDTIFQIFRKLGTPTEAEWPGVVDLPDFKLTFPKWSRQPWAEIRNIGTQLGSNGMQLIDQMLKYDPLRRISARQALLHSYFVLTEADVAMGDC